MAVPTGLQADLALFLTDIESRLARIEAPQGFQRAFLTTSASLTSTSASQFGAGWAFATDLKTAVYSDGVHWRRSDTGATIA